ncbi:MAG: AAA family ATPase [Deltaproteobacteria bacterium]|nr:MAG: AAA family ATPase [Deltaproteobacteria bacterium]
MVTHAADQLKISCPGAKIESGSNATHRMAVELALSDPSFYPHPVKRIQIEETHISKVFLTGDFVYKLKKPVDLGFLDFTSLEKRRRFCEKEVLLNRRFSREVYLDVVAITLERDGYALNGPGKPVEYVVRMRQLPRDKTMLELMKQGKVKDVMLQELVRLLSRFYEGAQRGPEIDAYGSRRAIELNTEEDFIDTEPFVPSILNKKKFSHLHQAVLSFIEDRAELLQRRISTGFIRDCHGDLRLGHIYFLDRNDFPNGIQIIDCIEFNDRFRYGDVAADLAFLAMELDYYCFSEAGQALLTGYARAADDPEVFLVLDFYKCYRAHVRCKVECIRQSAGDLLASKATLAVERAKRYFDLAYQYAATFSHPTLWIVCGLIGSGKSTIASEMSERMCLRIHESDAIRKKFFGFRPREPAVKPYGEGIYTPVATAQTYERILLAAREELFSGKSVILDATFGRRQHRDAFRCLAEEMGANVIFVECLSPDSVLRQRLAVRQAQASISDARLQHLEAHRRAFEPLTELAGDIHLPVRTDQPLQQILQQIFSTAYLLEGKQSTESQLV